MKPEFSGIERRLQRLNDCLQRLEPLKERRLTDFLREPYLRDLVERNLEVSAQCCIDIANRIISLESALKPDDYHRSILCLGELGVLPIDFAQRLAPIAGFRNLLVHEYLDLDWEQVYANLRQIQDLYDFAEYVSEWLGKRAGT